MALSTNSIAQKLACIIGEASVVSWQDLTTIQRHRLAQAVHPESSVDCIAYPNTQVELSEIVACANHHRWRILACGAGTKLSWGALARGTNLIISTERLNCLIEHAAGDLTVTVEAGIPLSTLQVALRAASQFLALDPAYSDQATVGGIVATRDAGSLQQRYGGIRDMCLGIALVRADGQKVKAGGRVVKNVAGYDLMKLLAGSFGTLGIISEVTLRLYPVPEAAKTVLLFGSAEFVAQTQKNLCSSNLTPTAMDLLSRRTLAALEMAGELGLVVRFQSLQPSVDLQSDRLLEVGQALGLQGKIWAAPEEANIWQLVQHQVWQSKLSKNQPIVCKVGVLPSEAVRTLTTIEAICEQQGAICKALIHAGNGLGVVRIDCAAGIAAKTILRLRSSCNQANGFLTVLEAPATLKEELDVWGYTGNALACMRQIKHQFDPENLFGFNRFIGGI